MSNCKLALGTVQFGMPYGVNNKSGVPTEIELKQIFETATKASITLLDTASAYGNAEEKIGEHVANNFNIVSKFSRVTKKEEFQKMLNTSLGKLRSSSIYGYLAHNAENLIEYPFIWDLLLDSREKGHIRKIGFSLYTTDQLEKLLSLKILPDLVQLPYSMLDRKFEKGIFLLKQNGCEIHVRSVFLQGLYFMDPERLPLKLASLKEPLKQLESLCKNYQIESAQLALNFVISNLNIDKVVIGVDNVEQLEKNIAAVNTWKNIPDIWEKVNSIKIANQELLNPVNW
jgi:aryl-alcohol dehydrogenase-like predicted oxidoreductase